MSSSAKSVKISQVYDPQGKLLMKKAFYHLIANDPDWGYTEQKVLASTDIGQYGADWKRAEANGNIRLKNCSTHFSSCKSNQYSGACTSCRGCGCRR